MQATRRTIFAALIAAGAVTALPARLSAEAPPLTIAMLIPGRIDDGGFMQAGYRGLVAIHDELGAATRYIDGIRNKIDPGSASDKDLYDLPPEELAEIPTVCGSLREALTCLENDHDFLLQGEVFTAGQIEGYIALKWPEVYMMEHTPHPVEYQMYYSL